MVGPVVETRFGRVRGAADEDLSVFRGVPFAEPPVGPLRFRPPLPPRPWRRIRDATRTVDAPPQVVSPLSRRLGLAPPGATGEDCLALDLWTPAVDGARRPVMVWIHGGGFAEGSAQAPATDGRHLCRRGDVVVVSVGYRLGPLGFLYVPDAHRAGLGRGCNWGLLDQVAALRWVRDHAERFGGDPENVTVFGQSAGAISVLALCAMPAARGLFRRAIAQSPTPAAVLAREEAARRSDAVREALGLEDAAGLREVPADELVKAAAACADARAAGGPFLLPVVDGEVLPLPPAEAVRRGEARDVQLLVGATRDERRLGLLGSDADDSEENAAALRAALAPALPGEGPDGRPALASLEDALLRLRERRGLPASPVDALLALRSDLEIRAPALRLAGWQSRLRPATYAYLFTWRSPVRDGALGAFHALDLPFVFGALDAAAWPELAGEGEDARRLSERMMDAWTAFARTGDPSHPGLGVPWPAHAPERPAAMELGASCGVREPWDEEERALLAPYLGIWSASGSVPSR